METKIRTFLKSLIDAPMLASLLRNACCGMPNSQLELAKHYLFESENFIEAYAWAEVACCRNLPGSQAIKQRAQALLRPEQTKKAWDLARDYKQAFIPNK